MGVPKPANEDQRLDELELLNILDTLSEEAYDRITKMAAQLFDMPIALITFVDEDRQWFKSKVGLDLDSTSREAAFCAHTILDEEPMIVEDAIEDERFRNNPLVLEDPEIRFYAGAPIKTGDDNLLGSVCVIDHKPRELTDRQVRVLQTLSDQVSTLLEMRKVSQELNEVKEQNRRLRQLIPMCSWCKNVRDDEDFWVNVEQFISKNSDSEVTHSICPDCSKELNKELHLV